MSKPHIIHCHSTFATGGKELRCAQLINAFGAGVEHSIVSAMPERMEAARMIAPSIQVHYPDTARFPALVGRPTPRRLFKIASALRPYDLILTYNWGAMDVAMAHTVFGEHFGLAPLIHHEDGFNEDEQIRLKKHRNWYRRIALGRAAGLVVPSETLEEIALDIWQQPLGRVKHIANGVDTKAFARRPKRDALPGVVKRKDEKWVGTVAGLRAVKNVPALVRAFARLPEEWQLVIVGDGESKAEILDEADRLRVTHRLHMPGFVANPASYIGLFDIFALSSRTEQAPISLIEAMAAGVPVAAYGVGDIANMVAADNGDFIITPNDETALSEVLATLAADKGLRAKLGEANRQKALQLFDEAHMVASYRRLYANAMGRKTLP